MASFRDHILMQSSMKHTVIWRERGRERERERESEREGERGRGRERERGRGRERPNNMCKRLNHFLQV